MSIGSADEKACPKGRVLHGTPIEQWIEAANIVEMRGETTFGGFDHCGLEIPENSSGLGLSERQETLAGGNETRD